MSERFSASVAARIMSCPASANLEDAILGWQAPVEDRTVDNAANRGTSKHEMLEPIMKLSPSEIDGMAKFLRYVADLRKTRRFKVMVEESIEAAWLITKPTTTPDLVLYTQDEIHVVDGKWGRIHVDPFQNAQLLYYAACVAPLAPRAKGVRLHILQPATDNFDSWFADTNVLKDFIVRAQEAEAKVLNKDLTFGPSDECKFCPANPHSRGQKGSPLCPPMLHMLYPPKVDEDEILAL